MLEFKGKKIYELDSSEIRECYDLLRAQQDRLTREATECFFIGDEVFFQSRKGMKVYGTVEKVNRKTIIVKEEDSFRTWRVSANLLHDSDR